MKNRNVIALISLLALLMFGLAAVNYAYKHDMKSYDGSGTDVAALYNDPENYDVSGANGVADVIVKENLSKTMAANNTAAVVFDFRGYDTLGESFILLTAIAGSFAILGRHIKRKEGESV